MWERSARVNECADRRVRGCELGVDDWRATSIRFAVDQSMAAETSQAERESVAVCTAPTLNQTRPQARMKESERGRERRHCYVRRVPA